MTRREAWNDVRGHAEYQGDGAGRAGSRWAALVALSEGVEEKLPDDPG